MKKNASKTANLNPKPCRPPGDAFWNLADSFLQAAKAAHDALRHRGGIGDISGPIAFLYLRSLELGCKVCLPKEKYSDKRVMKEFGHKITLLLNELEKNGTLADIK